MTKAILALVLVAVLYGGWALYSHYEQIGNEKEEKKAAVASVVVGEQLPGMTNKLETSLRSVQQQGPAAMAKWLKTYGSKIQDPRKAWIELDYCVLLARDNPAEARRVFAEVKQRTSPSSPVWPRIQELAKTYQ
jgi:hypothetical protein